MRVARSIIRPAIPAALLALLVAAGSHAVVAAGPEPGASPLAPGCRTPEPASSSAPGALDVPESPPDAGATEEPASPPATLASPPPTVDPCTAVAAASADARTLVVTIEAGDMWFGPDALTIPAEGVTTITLVDVGYAVHNLTIDDLGLLVVASPGRSDQVTIVDPAPGTYEFYCSISGHREAGMVGRLIVE